MNGDEIVGFIQEFLVVGLLLVTPTVVTSLVVGLLISILQTITSIQEQTMTFAPRILAVAIVMGLTLSWSLNLLADFTQRVFSRLIEVASP